MLPIVVAGALVGLLIAGIALSFALLVHLVPLALVALCVWAIVNLTRHPRVASAGRD
jgi:hypothetical protein